VKAIKDAWTLTLMFLRPSLRYGEFGGILELIMVNFLGIIPVVLLSIIGLDVKHALIGAIVSIMSFTSTGAMVSTIILDKQRKFKDMLVASPVKPLSYGLGIALSLLLYNLTPLSVYLSLAALLGVFNAASLLLVPALLLPWLSATSLGFFLATYLSPLRPGRAVQLTNFVSYLIGWLPPVYYPKELLGQYSWIAYLGPASNAAYILRAYAGLSPGSDLIYHWSALMVLTFLFLLLTGYKSRWVDT
jgi:ABC-type multidrug transport system permease subunit